MWSPNKAVCCVRTESHVLWPQNCWHGSMGQPSHMWVASNKTVLARPMEGRRALKIRQSHSRESLTRHSGSFSWVSSGDQKRILIFTLWIYLLAVGYPTFQSYPMIWRPLSHIGHQCGLSIRWYHECGLSTFTPSGLSVWKEMGIRTSMITGILWRRLLCFASLRLHLIKRAL